MYICIYVYVYIYIYIYTHMYIYIYRERERDYVHMYYMFVYVCSVAPRHKLSDFSRVSGDSELVEARRAERLENDSHQ